MRSKGIQAGSGLRSAGSVGLIPGTAGEGSPQMGFVKAAGPFAAACLGHRQLSAVKSKWRKSRHNPHPPEPDLPSLSGGLHAGGWEGVQWGCPKSRHLPPFTVLFVQWTWRLIIDSQGQETGARGSAGCHGLSLPPCFTRTTDRCGLRHCRSQKVRGRSCMPLHELSRLHMRKSLLPANLRPCCCSKESRNWALELFGCGWKLVSMGMGTVTSKFSGDLGSPLGQMQDEAGVPYSRTVRGGGKSAGVEVRYLFLPSLPSTNGY